MAETLFLTATTKAARYAELLPQIEALAAPEPDLPLHRLNDAKADAAGRLYFGTMPMACDTPTGSLYRYDPDATLTRLDTGYSVANGPAISAVM